MEIKREITNHRIKKNIEKKRIFERIKIIKNLIKKKGVGGILRILKIKKLLVFFHLRVFSGEKEKIIRKI